MKLRIGTRGSKLALWQAEHVQSILHEHGVHSEIVIIHTQGDKVQNVALHQVGGVGLFTKALDEALLADEIDIAVHSSKDMPAQVDAALSIIAILKREDPRDALLAVKPDVHFENFTRPLVIGTSSLRRVALLKSYFPDIQIKDIRGNVDSRIAKLEAGEYDGIMLACAGVKRLGLEKYIVQKLNTQSFTPAVGQGAIAVTSRTNFGHIEPIRSALNHSETESAVMCERSFLRTMQGGCTTPIFGFATVTGDKLSLHAGIAATDGSAVHRHTMEGSVAEAESIGQQVATHVLSAINSSVTSFQVRPAEL